MTLTGGKRKANKTFKAWVAFVKKVQKEENISSYKDAIHRAKQRSDKGEKWKTMKGGDGEDTIEEEIVTPREEEEEEIVTPREEEKEGGKMKGGIILGGKRKSARRRSARRTRGRSVRRTRGRSAHRTRGRSVRRTRGRY
jgi:hypothetical protein